MKRLSRVLLLACALLVSGCTDITDSFKPGSFGQTDQEEAMVAAIIEKYGDVTQDGDPRFLEVMMTSQVENFVPVDQVTSYSQESDKLYVWFIYDNFDEDPISVEWIYVDDSYSIHTFESQTGKDFGRGTFILEQPDDGWPLGNYEVVIKGSGIRESVGFDIIAGPTVSKSLHMPDGKVVLPVNPGWYLTGWDEFLSSADVTISGATERVLMGTTSKMYDTQEGTGSKNDYVIKMARTAADGGVIGGGAVSITWTDPPEYLVPGARASFTINRSFDSDWGISKMTASWDAHDVNPGGGTASSISLTTTDGSRSWSAYQGPIELGKVPEGRSGDKKAIILMLGNTYGYRYNYEWRE